MSQACLIGKSGDGSVSKKHVEAKVHFFCDPEELQSIVRLLQSYCGHAMADTLRVNTVTIDSVRVDGNFYDGAYNG